VILEYPFEDKTKEGDPFHPWGGEGAPVREGRDVWLLYFCVLVYKQQKSKKKTRVEAEATRDKKRHQSD